MMLSRSIRAHCAGCVFCLLLAFPAFSQSAQISGIVSDPAGAVISSAQVEIVNQKTQSTVSTSTNGGGLYSLSSLTPGTYTIRISAPNFETDVIRDVTIDVAGKVSKDVTLRLGSRSEELQVDGSAQAINTTDASVSTVVDHRFVENLPLNGRSFQSLMTLAPGVEVVPSAGSGSSGELSVNGQRTEAN